MMAMANEDVNLNLSLARDKHRVSIKVHSRVSIDTTVRRPMRKTTLPMIRYEV